MIELTIASEGLNASYGLTDRIEASLAAAAAREGIVSVGVLREGF